MKNKLMRVIKSNRVLYLFGVTLNNFLLDFQVFINLKIQTCRRVIDMVQ